MPTGDDDARAAGFLNAADMAHYAEAMREEEEVGRWIEAGAPSALDMWRQLDGVAPIDAVPLTVKQAARRLNVSEKYVRRRLPLLEAMDPPGARRIGNGARAPWRIVPAALDRLADAGSVQPQPAAAPRGRRSTPKPKKRSATRWEL